MKKILILIFFLRIFLTYLPSFHIDMTDWQAWSQRLVQLGPIYFYSPTYFSDYFPGYLYILYFLGLTYKLFLPNFSIFSLGFEIYLKIFTNLFDLATAFLIFKIISNYHKKGAGFAAIFYLANPALIFNSSVWGQVDGILTFFLIYCLYYLIEVKNVFKFNSFLSLAILVKPQGLAIFPISLIYLFANFSYKKYLTLLLIPLILLFASLPFFPKDPVFGLFNLFQKSTNTYPYTSMFSYNFWSLVGWWVSDSIKWMGLSYKVWGTLIYFTSLIVIISPFFVRKNYKNNFLIYFSIALASFAFFLFLTRIHQRYLFPFFAFLAVAAFIKNSLTLKLLYIMLSLVHFINLWYVYYYYNYVYSNPKFASFFVYHIVNSTSKLFAILNLTGFGLLLLIYYKKAYFDVQKISEN